MKKNIFIGVLSLIVFQSIGGFGQEKNSSKSEVQQWNFPKCSQNADNLYNRQKVLEQLASTLNSSIPEYYEFFGVKFTVENGRSISFFVYDLTDLANKSSLRGGCIDFKNNHIYHFAPISKMFSFSHILILEDGNLKLFRSINCRERTDERLEDVLSYLNKKLKNEKNKEKIIENVKNYRKYGLYWDGDNPYLRCQEVEM